MTFIGIISEYNTFESIKEILRKNLIKDTKLIHINKKSIENIKNIKFETIIIDVSLNEYINELCTIKRMCDNSKYVVINTYINTDFGIYNFKSTLITYGLNRKATITISSITESSILIYLQRNIKNANGKIVEIGEERIRVREEEKIKIYEVLIIYTIFLIKQRPITEQIQEKSNFFE